MGLAVALLALAATARRLNARIREAWHAEDLVDTGPCTVTLQDGPWDRGTVRLVGLPAIGSRVGGSRRWLGFDERDGHYCVSEVSVLYRCAVAEWIPHAQIDTRSGRLAGYA